VTAAKRVLVTGAGGFIGRWSIPALLNLGFEVHAVLSSANHGVPSELLGCTAHTADLLDEADAAALIKEIRPSHLLHFAWIATPGVYWQSADNLRWLAAGEHLLRQFREGGGVRAVFAGSCVEYDWSRGGVCDERSSPLADASAVPLSPYAASKLAMFRKLTEFAAEERMSAAWGRIFFQFGPNEHPDRLVPSVIRSLLKGEAALCTHGKQVRSFLHAADVGAAFASLLNVSVEGPVNIGSDQSITLADLIGRIARLIGRPELVQLGARIAPANEPAVLLPDVHRLRDEVRWRPRFTLDEGLTDTIDWWRGRLQ
jgi:nucleoside-diphosphate-sugar epimerase